MEEQLGNIEIQLGNQRRRIENGRALALGDWQPVVVDEVYTADTDGFLLAFSGGNGDIATFLLGTGEDAPTTRTRGRQYDGAATPVKRGSRYRVQVDSGDRGTITAYWIPLQEMEE